MKACLKDDILYIDGVDVPTYKKGGSIVRNSYFWALKSIAGSARRDHDWEFEPEVWFALNRLLLSFRTSSYLTLSETLLEFEPDTPIPPVLRSASTWR